MNADALNAALETVEQDALRRMAQHAARHGGVPHFFSERDTFDRIEGTSMVVRRNNHVKPLTVPADGEYGAD